MMKLFLSLVLLLSFSTHCFSKDTLVIGKVTVSERKNTYQSMKPLVDFVATQLSGYGITKGDVFFTNTNEEMTAALLAGKVDWVTDSTFSAIILSEKTGAKIALKRWKADVSDYHSVIIVKKNSSIKNIHDLRGNVIAFEDIGSTSAYYLPFMVFIKNGMMPVQKESNKSIYSDNAVWYIFSHSEHKILRDLMDDTVEAAALSNLEYEQLLPKAMLQLRIIHSSDSCPQGLELFRKDLDENVRNKIVNILIEMNKQKSSMEILKKYFKTNSFKQLVEDKSIAQVRENIKLSIIPTRLNP